FQARLGSGGSAAGRQSRSSTYPQAFLVNLARRAVTEALVRALCVVKVEPRANAGLGLGHRRMALRYTSSYFRLRHSRSTKMLSTAYYEINEAEAPIVRLVYERYTVDGLSIGAITRLLNEQRIPTRKQTGRWERSTVWAMLPNPAYKGAAGFGK